MLFSLIFVLVLVTSQVGSEPANPLADTGQAEKLINSFLQCIVQSRAFPQQELSSRIKVMKKSLISSWNSRKTPKEKSQSTTLAFASALADLTKPGNSPASVILKKRTVQQCLQKGSLETEGNLNNAFVQEMMQLINALQEKSKNANIQPVGVSAIPQEQPKSFDLPKTFASPTGPIVKVDYQPPTPIASSESFSRNSDDLLPSYESKNPIRSQPENAFILSSFSVDTGFTKNIPLLPPKVPGFESLQGTKDRSQANLFSNPYDFSNNFGDSFSRNFDSSKNFQSPVASGLGGNSFGLSSQSSFENMGLSNLSPFSGTSTRVNSFQTPEPLSRNTGFSSNFGSAPDFSRSFGSVSDLSNNFGSASDFSTNLGPASDFSNNFGSASDFSNNFGSASDFSNNFGSVPDFSYNFGSVPDFSNNFESVPDFSNNFGLTSDFSNNFGLTSDFSNNFGLTSNSQTSALQSNINSFPVNFGSSNGFQADFGASVAEQPLGSNFETSALVKNDIKENLNLNTASTPQDTFSTYWNSNYNMDTTSNLEQTLDDFSSAYTFGSEKSAEVKNAFKDSLFLNIISSDNIMNFLQKVSKENADKFALELENNLGKTFGFKSNAFSQNIYQKLFMSSEYPLDEYSIADSLASQMSDNLNNKGILSNQQLTQSVEDAKKAIEEAITQISDQIINATSSKPEATSQETPTLNSGVAVDVDEKFYNQAKLSESTGKTIEIIKAKLTAAGIEKMINKKQLTEQSIAKIMTLYGEKLSKELNLELNADLMASFYKQIKDISRDKADLPLIFATAIANILENNAAIQTTNKENTIQAATNILLQCLSENFHFDVETQKEDTKKQKELDSTAENTENLRQIEADKESKDDSIEKPNKQKQIISEINTDGADKQDININTAMGKLGKFKDTITVDGLRDFSTTKETQANKETNDENKSKQPKVENEQKTDNKTKLSGTETITKNQNAKEDSRDNSVSNSELKQNFVNALKVKIQGTGIFETLLEKNLSDKDIKELSELYSKLLAEKFQILVGIDKIKLFSEGLSTIKTNSDYENAIKMLANVTADILIAENKLKSNNLKNVLDLTMQCAIETFSNVIGQDLSIDQRMPEAAGSDTNTDIMGNKDMDSKTILKVDNLKIDLDINKDKEMSINNKTPKMTKTDVMATDNLDIDILSLGEFVTDSKEEGKETGRNIQQTKGNTEISIKNISDLETKPNKNVKGGLGDRSETSTGKDIKSTFIDLLKAKAVETGINKDLETIQLNPQGVREMSETYTEIMSKKLQINIDDDTAISFFMKLLTYGKDLKLRFIDTFISMTADILSDQEKLSKNNLDSLSDAVIQCLLEAISQSFNLQIDTKAALAAAATIKIKSADMGETKIDADFDRSVDKLVLENNDRNTKDKAAEKMESTVMTDFQKPMTNVKTDMKLSDAFNLDMLADINEETKVDGKTLKNKENSNTDLKVQAADNDADFFGQRAAEPSAKIKPNDDITVQTGKNVNLKLDKEKGTPTISDSESKKKFTSLLKTKILETEKLNVLLKKSLTNENIVALSKLYAQQLSERLQVELKMDVVESFIGGFLIADRIAEEFAITLADITADILLDQKMLTASSLNMLAEVSAQCLSLSVSQLLNTDINPNVSATSESTGVPLNFNLGSSMPNQNPQTELGKQFVFNQESVDQSEAQVNIKDKNLNKDSLIVETTSMLEDVNKNPTIELSGERDDKSDKNNESIPKDNDDKEKDESLEKVNTSNDNLNSKFTEELKQKLAMDLATALASSEEFRLSVLTANLDDIMLALASAVEAVCGTEASVAFQKTFNASLSN